MTPRDLLEDLFRTAVAAVHPASCLPGHLPAPPVGGDLIVLAAGKAAGSMTEVAERHYRDAGLAPPRLKGIAVTRRGYGRPTRHIPVVEAGHPIQRVADYADWLTRFETALRALPDKQRQASLLPLLHNYQHPERPLRGSMAPTNVFRTAVQDAKIGPDKDIPHITPDVIVKYITDLQLLGMV